MASLEQRVLACEKCPRLRAHCREVARVKRAAYREQTYWGKPVPAFGDPRARVMLVGLAPGAHGANRTGRMFTGDRSGDFLYRALHAVGWANQPQSVDRADGLVLRDVYITAAARCAPPGNRPLPAELANCQPFLAEEIAACRKVQVVICLGRIALEAYLRAAGLAPRSAYPFGHGAYFAVQPHLLCSYHPSQQNTQTGRLTPSMLESVLRRAQGLLR